MKVRVPQMITAQQPQSLSGGNRLSPAQAERVAMMAEEAAEVAQMCGKILRFGFDSCHPDGGPTNLELLREEIDDILAVIRLMNEEELDGHFDDVPERIEKIKRKLFYSHHQG